MKVKLIIGLMGLFAMFGCSAPTYKPGDVYSVEAEDGKIGIVKVLALDPGIVHLRIYKNKYNTRPDSISTSELSLGRLGDEGGFGIGHIPIDIRGFKDWKPKLVTTEKVSDDELDGYNIWKEGQ